MLPKVYGASKHPCFLCKRKVKKTEEQIRADFAKFNKNTIFSGDKFEEVDESLKIQEAQGRALSVFNLKKTYPNGFTAVKEINIKMYQGQIFALLGHNGAGKTTTLSMLFGMVQPSDGSAYMLGYDIVNNM